jgi:hypothetical protein
MWKSWTPDFSVFVEKTGQSGVKSGCVRITGIQSLVYAHSCFENTQIQGSDTWDWVLKEVPRVVSITSEEFGICMYLLVEMFCVFIVTDKSRAKGKT